MDILVNKLRVLINHLPFMTEEQQNYAIGRANLDLDWYFSNHGKFIETDIGSWTRPPDQENTTGKRPKCRVCDWGVENKIYDNYCGGCGRAFDRSL